MVRENQNNVESELLRFISLIRDLDETEVRQVLDAERIRLLLGN